MGVGRGGKWERGGRRGEVRDTVWYLYTVTGVQVLYPHTVDVLTKGWCNVRCQMAGKCVECASLSLQKHWVRHTSQVLLLTSSANFQMSELCHQFFLWANVSKVLLWILI